ncbi:MAG: peptidase C1 [Candidatus Aminicenantes bacterium]|nr:MAG: peptidase C1 [Candidatus Aminicenantes bacterium]
MEGAMQSRIPTLCATTILALGFAAAVPAQEQPKDQLTYVEKTKYPVIEEMEAQNDELRAAAEAKTVEILAQVKEEAKARDEAKRELRFDMKDIGRPAGPAAFATQAWHFPPTPQYLTGTCWSFSATSFMESEIHRLSGQEIKLSEMWTAYWEYVNKASGYIETRGESIFDEGSQSAALLRVYREHGVVPLADYDGVLAEDGRFDHSLMESRMNEFLDWCRDTGFWDEEFIIDSIRRILDLTMGRPPETVEWNGMEYTPAAFLADACKIDPDQYVSLMSTLSVPFWSRGSYDVPDNWWHDTSYVNVPLDTWYEVIRSTATAGQSLVIGGDVSEPGLWGLEDIAVVPTFDIPGASIDQDSREFRFINKTSTDDHGIHLVGITQLGGHDWFLIKDSNRSSRRGQHEGYYFYRDDYVRLKMLTITVHRDRVADILERLQN